MMRGWVNGEERVLPAGTIHDLLLVLGMPPEGVAVAVDGEVVPRARLGDCVLREGQRIEVIRAVGGG